MSDSVASRHYLMGDIAAGVATGVLSGLLGVGGGLILVPILVFAFHMPHKNATATSLVAICATGTAGAASYAISESVAWLPAIALAVGGIGGARLGALLLQRFSERWLSISFAGLQFTVAIIFLIGIEPAPTTSHLATNVTEATGFLGIGLAAGILSALFGVGGGIIMVPLLVVATGFNQHLAEGTSLAAMVPIAFVGAWQHSRHNYTQWGKGLRIGTAGIIGAIAGSAIALALPAEQLQRVFAVLALLLGLRFIVDAHSRRKQVRPPK